MSNFQQRIKEGFHERDYLIRPQGSEGGRYANVWVKGKALVVSEGALRVCFLLQSHRVLLLKGF